MFTKRFMIRFVLGLLGVVVIGAVAMILPAQAAPIQVQSYAAVSEPACNSCHDSGYYNYDLGKAYCVGSARTRCVDCHDGDPTALDKAVAHANLVAYPVINGDDSRCQSCHPEDSAARVERFAAIAGFRSIHFVTESTYNFTPQTVSTAAPASRTMKICPGRRNYF
jgi:hypothetical protein